MVRTLHFKSKEAFRKYNAYRFIHGVKHPAGMPFPKVNIKGHLHKVVHMK